LHAECRRVLTNRVEETLGLETVRRQAVSSSKSETIRLGLSHSPAKGGMTECHICNYRDIVI
jgi:hypothetical protein